MWDWQWLIHSIIFLFSQVDKLDITRKFSRPILDEAKSIYLKWVLGSSHYPSDSYILHQVILSNVHGWMWLVGKIAFVRTNSHHECLCVGVSYILHYKSTHKYVQSPSLKQTQIISLQIPEQWLTLLSMSMHDSSTSATWLSLLALCRITKENS